MDSKAWYQSKSMWLAIFSALTPVVTAAFPPAGVFIAANADWLAAGLGVAFGGLRLVTSSPLRAK